MHISFSHLSQRTCVIHYHFFLWQIILYMNVNFSMVCLHANITVFNLHNCDIQYFNLQFQVVSRSPTINSCASVLDTDGHLYLFIGWNDCHGQDEKEREGYEDTFILNIRRYISQHLPSQYMPDLITLARNIPYTRHGGFCLGFY